MAYNEDISFYSDYSDYSNCTNVCSNIGCTQHAASGYNNASYCYNHSNYNQYTCTDNEYSHWGYYVNCYRHAEGGYGNAYHHDQDVGCNQSSGCTNHSNSGYYNYHNATSICSNHTDSAKSVNHSIRNKGLPKAISWSSAWSSPPPGASVNASYVTEAMSAIRELKNNIQNPTTGIADKLHRNAVASPNLEDVSNNEFDDGVSSTTETPKAISQFNKMVSNLDKIWGATKRDGNIDPEIDDNNPGDSLILEELEDTADKVREIAVYNDPNYLNHHNYTQYVNLSNTHVNTVYNDAYVNSDHRNTQHTDYNGSCSDHANYVNYLNHKV